MDTKIQEKINCWNCFTGGGSQLKHIKQLWNTSLEWIPELDIQMSIWQVIQAKKFQIHYMQQLLDY
jgi:hypothetical protein